MDKSMPVTNVSSVRNPSHQTKKKSWEISSKREIIKKSPQKWKVVDTNPFDPTLGEGVCHRSVSSLMNMHTRIHEFKADGSGSLTNMTMRSTPKEGKHELISVEGSKMQSERTLLENKLGEEMEADYSSLVPTRTSVKESSNNPVMDKESKKSIERVAATISELLLKRIDPTLCSGVMGKEEVGALAI